MSRALLLLVAVPMVAWAQAAAAPEADFVLPTFAADAGTAASPSSAPHPPPKPEPRWATLTGSASLLFVGLSSAFLAADLFVGRLFGARDVELHDEDRFVSGWIVAPGLEASIGRWGSPICFGPLFCGTRFTGGAGVKGGWAKGLALDSANGEAHPGFMISGQLSVLGGFITIPSAPLSPGGSWAELVVRARVGVQLSNPTQLRHPNSSFIPSLAFVTELVPLGAQSRGVSVGAALGLAF